MKESRLLATVRERLKRDTSRARCKNCETLCPLDQFPVSAKTGRPLLSRCKECTNEASKRYYRDKWLATLDAQLPTRTTLNIESEIHFLQEKLSALRAELRRRGA